MWLKLYFYPSQVPVNFTIYFKKVVLSKMKHIIKIVLLFILYFKSSIYIFLQFLSSYFFFFFMINHVRISETPQIHILNSYWYVEFTNNICMAERPHTINLVMFESAFNLRDFGANNYYLRATFNEAPIKTFLCRVDPYLVQRIRLVLGNVPCDVFFY